MNKKYDKTKYIGKISEHVDLDDGIYGGLWGFGNPYLFQLRNCSKYFEKPLATYDKKGKAYPCYSFKMEVINKEGFILRCVYDIIINGRKVDTYEAYEDYHDFDAPFRKKFPQYYGLIKQFDHINLVISDVDIDGNKKVGSKTTFINSYVKPFLKSGKHI